MFPLRKDTDADEVACWQRPPRKYVIGEDKPWVSLILSFFVKSNKSYRCRKKCKSLRAPRTEYDYYQRIVRNIIAV